MEKMLETILQSPIANLFIVAGLAFLGVAVVGNISGKIQPGTGGRVVSGLIGVILMGMGLTMYSSQPPSGAASPTDVPASNVKLVSTAVPTVSIPTAMIPTPAPSGFRIAEVFLRADPFDYAGPCPVTVTFSGRISVAGGGGTVSYKFLRNDGASAPIQTLIFNGPGSQDISETWQIGAAGMIYSGWEAIQTFDPQEITSDHADFKIQCQ